MLTKDINNKEQSWEWVTPCDSWPENLKTETHDCLLKTKHSGTATCSRIIMRRLPCTNHQEGAPLEKTISCSDTSLWKFQIEPAKIDPGPALTLAQIRFQVRWGPSSVAGWMGHGWCRKTFVLSGWGLFRTGSLRSALLGHFIFPHVNVHAFMPLCYLLVCYVVFWNAQNKTN